MTYTATTDRIVKGKTFGALVFLVVFPLLTVLFNREIIWDICFFTFLFVVIYTYIHKPSKYQVEDDKIIVRRPIGNVEIRMQDIARIDPIHHDLLKNATKGGAFGYMGKFDTYLGKTMWYGTRRDHIVLITKTDDSKIVLTPDQREEFIEQVSSRLRR